MELLSAQAIPRQGQALPRRVLRAEVLLVLGVSLGQSAVYAIDGEWKSLTDLHSLSVVHTRTNRSHRLRQA